ncbi:MULTISPECIES: hypothetical protein [unclassified Synechococcus]|uniref:hypothetical protein n=1 Tax=unclassified Synechococcus TaxID=2626047 RepID=UPI002001A9F3|nr:hypothetical protein [Synechococcus sp. A10-1-5-1]UPM50156.1 hypothetical protein MY494_12770 [Synechococcus sp. A10-1-5-1]
MSPSSITPQVKLHYWTNGGAQSVVVPLDEEVKRHRLLLSHGAVLLKRELIAD